MFKKIITQPIIFIIIFAFLLRIASLNYGLPMWLYNDEQPFVLATLKMMQLKTLLPVLHQEAFTPFFYYPPYINYLYLPFFVLTTGISLIGFPGTLSDFQTQIASDPSVFFITGRLIVILISLTSIYLVYKTTEFLTKEKKSALIAAFLTATSVVHLTLSITGKHWVPIFFFYTLALFCLSHPQWSLKKRFLLASIVTGVGTGVSTIVILFSFYMALWFWLHENKKVKELFTQWTLYKSAIIIAGLSIVPIILYPASLGFVPDTTLKDYKTLIGAFSSVFIFPKELLFIEPVIMLLFFTGLYFAIRKKEKFFLSSVIFITFYSVIFYFFFRFEQRFLLPIILFLIIGASFGIKELRNILPKKVWSASIYALILITVIISARLSFLGFVNDSRVHTKNWLIENGAQNEKVIVYANLMRLPNTKEGVLEQEKIDPKSLRTVDQAEKNIRDEIRREPPFHVLNLYTVRNKDFYKNIKDYTKKEKYKYLIVSKEDFLDNKEQFEQVRSLIEKSTLVASFGNNESHYSLAKSEIGPTLLPLFKIKEFGPEIEIYKLEF
ncbi:MAG: hypothetical protein QG585_413 [Patescibacteria group bacterium]|nr:hypothetical protein [Patescibacteria group bacterium]